MPLSAATSPAVPVPSDGPGPGRGVPGAGGPDGPETDASGSGAVGPDGSAPDEIGLEKLLLFPHKLAALPGNLSGADPSYPVSVELSLTSACDLECVWCSDRALRAVCPDRLDPGVLRRLFGDLAAGGTRGVTIEGGGEPTVSPLFPGAVRAAAEAGLSVGLITNGAWSRPPDRDVLEALQWIRVSLDACDPETYRRLKGRDRFRTVMGNLRRLAGLDLVLGAGHVVTRLNDDLGPLAALARELADAGLAYLHLRPVVDHPELASRADLSPLADLSRAGFRVNLGAMGHNRPSGNLGLPCLAHSLSSVVTADGSVWLCGRLNVDPAAAPIGSLLGGSFGGLWAGPERLRQARLAASGGWCRAHCPQCRMTKYNRLLDQVGRLRTRDFI
jgi:MoaA/NifB/PqqE/SkfB family radical SAM enzyme